MGCELHKNAFSDRAQPGPVGGAIACPILSSRYKGEGMEGRGRKKCTSPVEACLP